MTVVNTLSIFGLLFTVLYILAVLPAAAQRHQEIQNLTNAINREAAAQEAANATD